MKLMAQDLGFAYHPGADTRPVLSSFNFTAEPGSYWCLAGPNGSGKSTFLKLACGLLSTPGFTGQLSWNDRSIRDWSRLELARNVAFVPGSIKSQFPVSVGEFVLQGRYARSANFWAHPTSDDVRIAQECVERVGIATLAESRIDEISAGETQLAMIARALAQEPQALVLDETTTNLDLAYQLRVFELLAELNRQGKTIIVVSHDLNLAAEFCPNAAWLGNGLLYTQGPMTETLTNDLMNDLYGINGRLEVGANPFTGKPKIFWK